jgi:hypothetical protein
LEYFPALHASQFEVDPVEGATLPDGQLVHAALPVPEAGGVEYLPVSQGVHEDDPEESENVPSVQASHDGFPSLEVYFPIPQGVQSDSEVAPEFWPYFPESQATQSLALPTADVEYFPAAHLEHAVLLEEEYSPAPQTEHDSDALDVLI